MNPNPNIPAGGWPDYPDSRHAHGVELVQLETQQAIEQALITLRATFSTFPQLTIHSVGDTSRVGHQRIWWRDNPLFSGSGGPLSICPRHAVIPVIAALETELSRLRGERRRSTLRGAA